MSSDFAAWVSGWRNDDAYNNAFHQELTQAVNERPHLKEHRDWVEANQFGFGDRPFHRVWEGIVETMPVEFAFLEVGVFKGQITSLVQLLAKLQNKVAVVFGVTTLTNTEDTRCKYPPGDYMAWINQIHNQFKVIPPELIVGKSTSPDVIEQVTSLVYHIVYIDAGHDYADVCSDITNYAPCVRVGGLLVMDDASINRLKIGNCWPGLEDVSKAVADLLDKDDRFKFLFCCGHINIFQRIK
jgi:hypothetical protein